MKPLRYVALSLFAVTLSGCQTLDAMRQDFSSLEMPTLDVASDHNDELVYSGNCPRVEAIEELGQLSEFSDLNNQSQGNLISRIDISKVQSACSYGTNNVTVDLRMDFTGKLGPQGRAASSDRPFFSYPFFVAVTSANGTILAKEIFAASLTYNPGENTQTYTEKMRQIIPVENRSNAAHYKILAGFQLTPDQLAYNREEIAARKAAEKAAREQAEREARKQAQAEKEAAMQKAASAAMTSGTPTTQSSSKIYTSAPVAITP